MAMSEGTLQLLVKAALPVGAQFGRENFAGDPFVQDFVLLAQEELGTKADIFVSWSCPPDVSILTSKNANILVRSERLDPLLVEYLLLSLTAGFVTEFQRDVALRSNVLRWMAEFLLGYRWPQAALYAALHAHDIRLGMPAPRPFRDEILDSVPALERTALQCFSLAHELAHLRPSTRQEMSLETAVDGICLSQHIKRDIAEAQQHEAMESLLDLADERRDAVNLLREIDADLLALELVFLYLAKTFQASLEETMHAVLQAFEAQCYLYAIKKNCMLLKRHAGQNKSEEDYIIEGWLSSTQISVRARCVLRRAGIVLARWAAQEEEQTAEVINRFVPVIDEMFIRRQEFMSELGRVAHEEAQNLFEILPAIGSNESKAMFQVLLDQVHLSGEIRGDLFFMLVAMGHPGGTDPINWFEHLYALQEVGT